MTRSAIIWRRSGAYGNFFMRRELYKLRIQKVAACAVDRSI
jgi:hypothetical protein